MYTVIDIETTGGSPKSDRITEIAIFVYDGEKVIDEFVSLVNPEKSIEPFITRLTGITNEMLADAPKFYEIAKRIVEITENRIFVAHNANFDYNFIKTEFANLGFDYKRQVVDTVRLARILIPGRRSYSLGNICSDLGIPINGRHRAAGDAEATTKLFGMLLNLDGKKKPLVSEMTSLKFDGMNPDFDPKLINNLPEATGVYYFYNAKNDIIYVGKSKNIKNRVIQHFQNKDTGKALEMKNNISSISYKITGSELTALLLESAEIKNHTPIYNRAQRRTSYSWGIYSFTDEQGYLQFELKRNLKNNLPLSAFATKQSGITALEFLRTEYKLCQKLCGLYPSNGACFAHSIKQCNGACIGDELPQIYNKRAEAAQKSLEFEHPDFLLVDVGRNSNELSVVRVAKGMYAGFGYIDKDAAYSTEMLIDSIKRFPDNRDVRQIIKSYIKSNKAIKYINLTSK